MISEALLHPQPGQNSWKEDSLILLCLAQACKCKMRLLAKARELAMNSLVHILSAEIIARGLSDCKASRLPNE